MIQSAGWRFAPVKLTRLDEKWIFECFTYLKLQHDSDEIARHCHHFEETMLEDFPPETFLQNPKMLTQLLARLTSSPHAVAGTSSSQHSPAHLKVHEAVVSAVQALVRALYYYSP